MQCLSLCAFRTFGRRTQKRRSIFIGAANHPWMKLWYGVLDLPHKENTKETREAITPIVDTVKLRVSKYPIDRSQGSAKNDPEMGKSDLTNSENPVELL